MTTIFGTNGQDFLSGQFDIVETINGWDINNAPGDEGPATDFDIIYGGTGDTINGGNGGDWLTGFGANVTINGGAGSDLISIDGNGIGDVIDGGSGDDRLSMTRLTDGTVGLTISIADPSILQQLADGTSFVNIEQLFFYGGGGADSIIGGALQDDIRGGGGDDYIVGGAGNDILEGGQGIDTISYASSVGGISLDLGTVFGSASGGDASGDILLDSFENVVGSNADDHIVGSSFANDLKGNGGNDFLTGAGGDDSIDGGDGSDTAIYAGSFDSYVKYYDASNDTFIISGGAEGTDKVRQIESFQFADGTKSLAEMKAASDVIHAVSIVANTASANEGNAGPTQFTFTVSLDGASASTQTIEYNISGTGLAPASFDDFSGQLSGTISFLPGETTKVISVDVNGDIDVESDEEFAVTLRNPSLGLVTSTSVATAIILNDDVINTITGTENGEHILGTDGRDHIFALGGDDTIFGFDGNDKLLGGTGSDWIIGGRGADEIDGGELVPGEYRFDVVGYVDEVLYQGGTQGVVVNLSEVDQSGQAAGTATDAFGTVDTLKNINVVYGTTFADTVYASGAGGVSEEGTLIYGLGGNDTIVGNIGVDLVFYDRDEELGGLAQKGIIANLSANTVSAAGEIVSSSSIRDGFGDTDSVSSIEAVRGTAYADFMFGGAADEFFIGLNGNDVFEGGAGTDTVSYRKDHFYLGGTNSVVVNLSASTVKVGGIKVVAGHAIDGFGSNDTLIGIETVYGTEQDDTMFASVTGNTFHGEGGNDKLNGGKGKDFLDGGTGADTMRGGAGDDFYLVDNLADKVVELGQGGNDTVATTLVNYSLVALSNAENLVYVGTADFVGRGNSSANLLVGGIGNDHLDGGAGKDSFLGGAGDDTMTGGMGNDVFVFNALSTGLSFGNDIITDFKGGSRLADQVSIDHNLGYYSAAEVLAALVIEGADKVLHLSDGSSITFQNKAGLAFAIDDFLIG